MSEIALPDRRTRRHLMLPRLPLAVYREVVAHLQAIEGVSVGLLPQTDRTFDYLQSQVGGLWLEVDPTAAPETADRVAGVLQHYGDRYGTGYADRFGRWQELDPT